MTVTPAFTIEEWKDIRNQDLTYLQDGVTSLAPYGGLTTNAIAHLRDEWIEWRDEHVSIRVPETASCNSYKLVGGSGGGLPTLQERDEPCNYCRKTGETDRFEHIKEDFGRTEEPIQYEALLHREIASPAVEFLTTTFETYGRSEIGATPAGVVSAAKAATGGSDFDEESVARLVKTGPVVYDYYGLEIDVITELTPYATETIKNILYETGDGQWTCMGIGEFLRTLKEVEPIEVKPLSNELGKSLPATRKRLKKLEQKGKVTESQHGSKYDYTSPSTWSTTTEWDTPFRCDRCGYTTWSIRGLQEHKSKAHGD